MKICVVGAHGNMGRRYCSILRYFGHDVLEHDIGSMPEGVSKCDGIIIATPTDTHYDVMMYYEHFGIPMLVEKPITKSLEQLIELMELKTTWRMINQYEYFEYQNQMKNPNILSMFDGKPHTEYDFFKSGSDTIIWDCINLIGLAKGTFKCANTSPIWNCVLNGHRLDYSKIDYSYIWNIHDWLEKFDDNRHYALKAHEKVFKILKYKMEDNLDDKL